MRFLTKFLFILEKFNLNLFKKNLTEYEINFEHKRQYATFYLKLDDLQLVVTSRKSH